MKFYRKLLLFIIALPLFSNAQSNFKPGFVITQKGDTLKGFIDLKEWSNSPTNFYFRSIINKSSTQNFTVHDIRYAEVSHVLAFRKFVCSISLDETTLQKISSSRDTSSKIDTVFLKVEQSGQFVTLYSYEDSEKRRCYVYDDKTKTINELIYRIYYVSNNASTVSQNAYKQQLLNIAQKLPTYDDKIKTLLEEAEYNSADLKLICSKINNTAVNDKQKADQKGTIKFFAGSGLGINTVIINGTFPLYNAAKSINTVWPLISIGVNMYPHPEVGRSMFRAEFTYWSLSYKNSGNSYY